MASYCVVHCQFQIAVTQCKHEHLYHHKWRLCAHLGSVTTAAMGKSRHLQNNLYYIVTSGKKVPYKYITFTQVI